MCAAQATFPPRGGGVRAWPALAVSMLAAVTASCSLSRMAVDALGDALAESGSTYARDDDPELVGQALPFALKTIESLLAESPEHEGLLLAAASGFTQYSYAYVHCEADYVEATDLARAGELRVRALRLYRRARDYGLRGLEVARSGFGAALRRDADEALAPLGKRDVALLYWTAAPWAAAASVSKEGEEVADLQLVEAMMRRALALDDRFGGGAIHDFFIAYEGSRPEAAGGSAARAEQHLQQALEHSGGARAAPLVAFAETVCVARQDKARFFELLDKALAIDPDRHPEQRVANLVAQRRARWLRTRVDELFVE